MLVGEQPGDAEDLAGQPFVGPAGQLLDAALAEVQLPREEVYLTNVVKHFKFVQRGKRRLHQKPGSREIAACQPWLDAELQTLQPQVVVCLGSTAAQARFGRDFRLSARNATAVAARFITRSPHVAVTTNRDKRLSSLPLERLEMVAQVNRRNDHSGQCPMH